MMKRSALLILASISTISGFVVGPLTAAQSKPDPSPLVSLKMAMAELPSNVEKYTQLPSLESCFTNDFIPAGLLKDHSTRDGTWGVIRVKTGKLQYNVGDESFELTLESPGIIQPSVKHSVKSLSDDLEFVVEFYRIPDELVTEFESKLGPSRD
jgi:tellurite resistance-related uncharacterized protein